MQGRGAVEVPVVDQCGRLKATKMNKFKQNTVRQFEAAINKHICASLSSPRSRKQKWPAVMFENWPIRPETNRLPNLDFRRQAYI